jgi:sirohydrochlorin ferrochelatase
MSELGTQLASVITTVHWCQKLWISIRNQRSFNTLLKVVDRRSRCHHQVQRVTTAMQALLLLDHGSIRQEANLLLEQLAALIQSLRPGLPVHFAHMELAEPSIAQGFEKCIQSGATEIIVHPYMLARGRHVNSDIPRLVEQIARKYLHVKVHITEPLGLHEKIAQVVLERTGL